MVAGQHRFARARPADETQHLAAHDVQVQTIQNDLLAKTDDDIAHANDPLRRLWRNGARPPGGSALLAAASRQRLDGGLVMRLWHRQ